MQKSAVVVTQHSVLGYVESFPGEGVGRSPIVSTLDMIIS